MCESLVLLALPSSSKVGPLAKRDASMGADATAQPLAKRGAQPKFFLVSLGTAMHEVQPRFHTFCLLFMPHM